MTAIGALQGVSLTGTQNKALDELLAVATDKTACLVELRSPPALGRGHGVTRILRALASSLGVPLLGVSTVLEANAASEEFGRPPKVLFEAACASLKANGVAIVDDMDIASAPLSVRRSRTLVGDVRGSGDVFHWDVSTAPSMLLKALSDAAAAVNGVLIFAAVEDTHLAFSKAPLAVVLGEQTSEDYRVVLENVLGPTAKSCDASEIFALHSQLSPSDLAAFAARLKSTASVKSVCENRNDAFLAAIREELIATSAVAPEEVEPVDLLNYPGLEGIKEELERNVLFPLEHPAKAAKLGLAPKRGVLVHGAPGTGKTTVGRWLAHRLKGKFFLVREMMLQADILKVFAAAQAAAPSIVFIDDADIVIGGWRPLDGHRGSDIFRFLLGRMDGLTSRGKRSRDNGDVVVMLTGQSVHWMADMLLRSGRIELWLKTKLPTPRQKEAILQKYIKEDSGAMELLSKDGEVPSVKAAAQASDNFCCADLRRLVSDAKMLAAWDQASAEDGKSDVKMLGGAAYLEKAAENVRKMQDEVHATARNLYG
eukprot:TRINITY_DN94492_c0_g1_i1.p1 TRINITY_DN94492_c0_g1~~TRINITY_DN94492_c0_g1_i1.p1  ORF type:complete len:540 (-),score=153.63 TRINITY_DN94492_c0_g1_i1:225-1844(-)